MPTAIVTGATGILGREIVHALGKDPQTWTSVHALSRSQKETYPSNVTHDHIDLQSSAASMASQIQDVTASHIFFAAYLAEDSEQANWDTNGAMLQNFLDALSQTGALKHLKRFILVTGAKKYGLQHGRVKVPMEESDPRIDGPHRAPNFYYNQIDILTRAANEAKGSFDWVITYPNDVIGVVPQTNFMNLSTSLGLYAAVSKELDGKLPWPGSTAFYDMAATFTTSRLHAQFCLWAALAQGVGNQDFNVINGDVETWENMWPKLAKRFGCEVPADQLAEESDGKLSSRTELDEKPPIMDIAGRNTGLERSQYAKASAIEARIDLEKWSQLPEVKEAWKRLATREGLEEEAFGKATWWFLKFILGRNFEILISGMKARKYGWTGFVDTWDSLEEVFDELEKMKVLPKTA